MNGPEAALYSSGPGVKPGGGEPLTVMVTVGAGDEETQEIRSTVIDRDYTCTSDGHNMTSCINQLAEWPDTFSLPNGRGSCMLLASLIYFSRNETFNSQSTVYMRFSTNVAACTKLKEKHKVFKCSDQGCGMRSKYKPPPSHFASVSRTGYDITKFVVRVAN